MLDWFTDLFTLEHLGYFVLGIISACTYHITKARIQNKIVIIKWQFITIPIAIGLAAYLAIQSQDNANCTREFNQAIRESRSITIENDALSIKHRGLLSEKGRAETQMWLAVLRPTDPTIAGLSLGDPVRQQYARNVVTAYSIKAGHLDTQILDIEEQQRRLALTRPALPGPTCGS